MNVRCCYILFLCGAFSFVASCNRESRNGVRKREADVQSLSRPNSAILEYYEDLPVVSISEFNLRRLDTSAPTRFASSRGMLDWDPYFSEIVVESASLYAEYGADRIIVIEWYGGFELAPVYSGIIGKTIDGTWHEISSGRLFDAIAQRITSDMGGCEDGHSMDIMKMLR